MTGKAKFYLKSDEDSKWTEVSREFYCETEIRLGLVGWLGAGNPVTQHFSIAGLRGKVDTGNKGWPPASAVYA